MELNLVTEGLKFMVLGMATVFSFLILMVIILHFQAKIINKFFPQKVVSTPSRASSTQKSSTQKDDKALVAAITAAITTFKNSKS
ncbi:OadG family protein [Sulfurospirillum arcachonense]|uniref:OadG family protein n=1 Tax=Sulfurospirillum arcachonense TaxID=57666 RepID=UPI000469DF0A|nr:OadG family protein [Sulfurospirillum arcachonense]